MIKENIHHDLTSRFYLLEIFGSGESVFYYLLVADLARKPKWFIQISSPVITGFRNIDNFEAPVTTRNISEFSFAFVL